MNENLSLPLKLSVRRITPLHVICGAYLWALEDEQGVEVAVVRPLPGETQKDSYERAVSLARFIEENWNRIYGGS